MTALPIEQLLLDLKTKDIRIWLEQDRLRVSAPKEGVPAELREELSLRKQEILDYLSLYGSRRVRGAIRLLLYPKMVGMAGAWW